MGKWINNSVIFSNLQQSWQYFLLRWFRRFILHLRRTSSQRGGLPSSTTSEDSYLWTKIIEFMLEMEGRKGDTLELFVYLVLLFDALYLCICFTTNRINAHLIITAGCAWMDLISFFFHFWLYIKGKPKSSNTNPTANLQRNPTNVNLKLIPHNIKLSNSAPHSPLSPNECTKAVPYEILQILS